MKPDRLILIVIIVVLTLFISTMLFAAQVMKKVERKAAVPEQQGALITSCYEASNLTLSQKDLENLEIVSSVLTDPYCCNKSYLSEGRLDCLEKNSATLEHIYGMLDKISNDIQKKCTNYDVLAPEHITCEVSQMGNLSNKIYDEAYCVKRIINKIGVKYDALTKCPND